MANSISEGFLRLTYANAYSVHHAMFPVNYEGTPVQGTEPSLTLKDATSEDATVAFADLMAVYRPLYDASVNFGLVEAYAVDADTEERTFLYGWNVGVNGNGTGGVNKGVMTTFTFKTVAGGVLKTVLMESVFETGFNLRPPYEVDSSWADWAAYVTSGNSLIIGRDNTYAFSPISFKSKESDTLRKRYDQ